MLLCRRSASTLRRVRCLQRSPVRRRARRSVTRAAHPRKGRSKWKRAAALAAVCTTKCEFDAIHLRRDHPEATKMIRSEDKMKAILPYMIKRAAKIKVKELRSKHS